MLEKCSIWTRFSKFLPAWQVITLSLLQMAFLLNVIYAHIQSDHEMKELDKLASSDSGNNNNDNRLKVPTILANVSTEFLFHPIESSGTTTNIMKLESENASSQHHSSRSSNSVSNHANSTSTPADSKLPGISINNSTTNKVEDKSKRHISDNDSKKFGKVGLYHRKKNHHRNGGWSDKSKLYRVKIRCKSVAKYSYLHQPVRPEFSCKKSKKNKKPKHPNGWISTSDTYMRPDRIRTSSNGINSIDYAIINSHISRG